MAPKVGYLLPTREGVMQGRPAAGPLLKLAERAEELLEVLVAHGWRHERTAQEQDWVAIRVRR